MSRYVLFSALILLIAVGAWAQPSGPGDVMFVAYNADGDDGFAFVTLVDIPNLTSINFSDKEWDGTMLTAGEGIGTWTNDTGFTISEGAVIIVDTTSTTPNPSEGSWTGDTLSLGSSNEQLYAYTTTRGTTTFISAFFNDDETSNSNTLTGTGLVVGTSAIVLDALDADGDVAVYNGVPHCNGLTRTQCQMQIADVTTNWIAQDGSGDQHQDMIAPDFPDDVTPTFATVPVELMTFSVE